MPQYVVHKIGFLYNDNFFEPGEARGNVMGISKSLEEATLLKKLEDIDTVQRMAGHNIHNFLRQHPDYEAVLQKLSVFYNKFNLKYAQDRECIPPNINEEDAAELLPITALSFHTVVEYGDDEVIHPNAFELDKDGDYYWR